MTALRMLPVLVLALAAIQVCWTVAVSDILYHLHASHGTYATHLLGSMDSLHDEAPLRYLCHLCLTVYDSATALGQHLAAQVGQLQLPA